MIGTTNGQRFGFLNELRNELKLSVVRERIQEELGEGQKIEAFQFLNRAREVLPIGNEAKTELKDVLVLQDNRWIIPISTEVGPHLFNLYGWKP